MLTRVSAKSDLAQAIGYTLTHWKALTRYCEDGRIEIDNNAAERALRGVSLGRKNYLFFGSDAGGERAAAIYSLVVTASSMGSIPRRTCATCSSASPIILSTASRSCCRGTSTDAQRSRNERRPEMVTKVQRRPTGSAILQVRIELRGTKPKVWRRVLCPDDHAGQAASGDSGGLRLGTRTLA